LAPPPAQPEAPKEAPPPGAPKGPSPELQRRIDATVAWANERFRSYYATQTPWLPPRFGRREFGFMFLAKGFMVRHTGFRSAGELQGYLVEHAPAHVYYSTAYYQDPRAETMKDKGWLGADLIFDLDADHMPQTEGKTFEEMLRIIQHEAVKLAQDFLLGDFGFKPEHIRAVFSGGRGYHLHVTDPAVLGLGSAERREIVDYLEGVGLDLERVLGTGRVAYVEERGPRRVRQKRTEARPDSAGWAGRIVRGEVELLEQMRGQSEDEVRDRLAAWGLKEPRKRARELHAFLHSEAHDRDGTTFRERFLATGNLPQGHALDKVLRAEAVKKQALEVAMGEADEPVTADIKRLIRLPGSVHGKTGLRVTEIALERLEAFDPLNEAVAFGDAPVTIEVSKPEVVRFGPQTWDLKPGKQELPEKVAMFVCLRRKGLVE